MVASFPSLHRRPEERVKDADTRERLAVLVDELLVALALQVPGLRRLVLEDGVQRHVEVLDADRLLDVLVFGDRADREVDRPLVTGEVLLARREETLPRLLRVILQREENHVGELRPRRALR